MYILYTKFSLLMLSLMAFIADNTKSIIILFEKFKYNVIIVADDPSVVSIDGNKIIGLKDGLTNVKLYVEGYPTSEYTVVVVVGKGI